MLSRRGVADDLRTSPYIQTIAYENDVIEYIFSSKVNYNKFEQRLKDSRDKLSTYLSTKYELPIDFDILADIKLYESIEHRGSLIKVNGKEVLWLSNIKLDGQIKIQQI